MATKNVAVYLGTYKGTYIARSDAGRRRWSVEGPFQAGENVYHAAPDPRHPGHVYSLANNAFWGPVLYRSIDGGRRWTEIGTPGLDRRRTRQPSFDEAPSSKPIVNLWHFEPGPPGSPRTLYVGVDPHYLYRSTDAGRTWENLRGIAEHPTRPEWNPGAGGRCLHTVILDPTRPHRMYIGISAAGTFRSDDGGESWIACNRGVRADFLPNKTPEVGQCVHHVAIDPDDPKVFYRQDHAGIYVSDDAMDHWRHVGGALDHDFGFAVATAPALPGGAIFAPLVGESRTMPGHRAQVQWYDRRTERFRPMIRTSPTTGDFTVRREGMVADRLDPAGIYLGTTTGDLIFSPNGGRSWGVVPYRFPTINSVSVSVAGR